MLRIGSWIATAAIGLSAGCASAPPNLPACTPTNSPKSICGLMNPEDLSHLPGLDWVVVSQMASVDREAEFGAPPSRPGNLLAIRVADGARQTIYPAQVEWELQSSGPEPRPGWGDPECPGAPLEEEFEPHGIDVGRHASGAPLLAVVNHGGRESVEFFEIRPGEQPEIEWRGCVEMPEGVSPNDVALFADGGFVVTKFMPPIDSFGPRAVWTVLKIQWGWDSGRVYRWAPGGEVTEIPGSEGSAPNGVAISRDETEIFVAQWGESNIYRVSLVEDASRMRREKASLYHHPDNLTWTDDGRLLVAGQGGSVLQILKCGGIENGGCGLDYGVYSIDPDTFQVDLLFTGKGAASVALEVGDEVFVGAFSGDQVERLSRPR